MSDKTEEISELQVLKSAAGYYVGRTYRSNEETGGAWFPYSRDSQYFRSRDAAQEYLSYLEEYD